VRTSSIPGCQKNVGRAGHPSKLETFKKCVAAYPYLFNQVAGDKGFRKLDLDLELFAQLVQKHGKDNVGDIHDYPVVFNVVEASQAEVDDEVKELKRMGQY
jgi:hypothetical protein